MRRRQLRIIAAGTFGAPAFEQVTGIPLQYNLLTLDRESGILIVETRKKEKTDGAWSADARWGDKNDLVPRYTIELQYGNRSKTGTFSNLPLKPPLQDGMKLKSQNLELDAHTINELIEILKTLMEDEKSRPFLIVALGNDAAVLQRINWSGTVADFIPDMVCKLASYGKIASGKQALWVLLEYARSQVGIDVQRRIDQLSPPINL